MAPSPLEYPPQPIEIDVESSRVLPSPSLSAYTKWEPTLSEPFEFWHQGDSGTAIKRDPLTQWYTDNDGPWIPKVIADVDPVEKWLRKSPGRMSYRGSYQQTNQSNAGSLRFSGPPWDSGYGTRRNAESASVFSADTDERDQDCQNLVGHSISDSSRLVCPTCNKPVKTRSELKKHDLRHRKPCKCQIPGCLGTNGFSTTNDLGRHIRSKHAEETSAKTGDKPTFHPNAPQTPSVVSPKVAAFATPVTSDLFAELEKTQQSVRDQAPINEDRIPVFKCAEPLETSGVSSKTITRLKEHIPRRHFSSMPRDDQNANIDELTKPCQAHNNDRKSPRIMGLTGAGKSYIVKSIISEREVRGKPTIIQQSGARATGRPRENKRKVLRVRIKGKEHLSCPDSGSEKNIMSESFAKEHEFEIRRGTKDLKRFELGSGKYVWSVGRVRVPVELFGNPLSRKKCWFYVLPNCPVPLIFGMQFLKEAEILTKNRHMLETCPTELSNISSLLWIGSPRHRVKCSLDGHDLVAVADTGSDLNLMSLKCAKREGFHIDRRREARTRIQVGDGTETETIGQVYVHSLGLDWRKAETSSTDDHSRVNMGDPLNSMQPVQDASEHEEDSGTFGAIFHVLPGLPCDVIFGRDLLDDTDAFNLCPELFSGPPSEPDDPFELNVLISLGPVSLNIPISRRSRRVTVVNPDPKEIHDDARHAEMFRRSNRDDEIALLPTEQQDRARAREKMRVREWVAGHSTCIYCNPV